MNNLNIYGFILICVSAFCNVMLKYKDHPDYVLPMWLSAIGAVLLLCLSMHMNNNQIAITFFVMWLAARFQSDTYAPIETIESNDND